MTQDQVRTQQQSDQKSPANVAAPAKGKSWEMSAQEALRVDYLTRSLYMPNAQTSAK